MQFSSDCCYLLIMRFDELYLWHDRVVARLVIERSRVQISPTVLSSTALNKPLTHTCLCHQAV